MRTENTFLKPDFAYPQTVEANAESALSAALRGKDYVKAVRAAMQITLARNAVSSEYNDSSLSLACDLSQRLPEPYGALMSLWEANIYSGIYNADEWTFNSRNLPLTAFPTSTADWSRDLFALKILELCQKTMEQKDALAAIPIEKLSGVVVSTPKSIEAYPTALDFAVQRMLDYLACFRTDSSVIPFGSAGNNTVARQLDDFMAYCIDYLISFHADREEWLAASLLMVEKSRSETNAKEYLMECYVKLKDTAACVPVVCALGDCRDFGNTRQYYELAKSVAERFPDAPMSSDLCISLARMEKEDASVSMHNRFQSTDTIRGIVTLGNVQEAWVGIYRVPTRDNYCKGSVVAASRQVALVPVKVSGEVPFKEETEFSCLPLHCGMYAVVVSPRKDIGRFLRESGTNMSFRTFQVSDLQVITAAGSKDSSKKFYVVDSHNLQPVAGAKVKISENYYSREKVSKTVYTDKDGCVVSPCDGHVCLEVEKDDDFLVANSYGSQYYADFDGTQYKSGLFTDLSIYRPGDHIGFSAVVYESSDHRFSLIKGKEVEVRLSDVNGTTVDSVRLVTDAFGRCNGSLAIPVGGVLGSYDIRMGMKGEKRGGSVVLGYSSVMVAEYKAPTFFVDVDGIKGSYHLGDTVCIKGRAMTYSGMPVAGAEVKFNVRYRSWWLLRGGAENASYGGSSMTGSDGSFSIELPTDGLRDTPYMLGAFSMTVAVTSGAGETCEASPVMFSLGDAYRIDAELPEKVDVEGDDSEFAVVVTDIMGNPVPRRVTYHLLDWEHDEEFAHGEFMSPDFPLDFKDIPSGLYDLKLCSEGAESVSHKIVVYRSSDRQAPYATPLWVPEKRIVAANGAKDVCVKVGSGFRDSWLLCRVSDDLGHAEDRWIKTADDIVDVKVAAPRSNGRVWVTFVGGHDLVCEEEEVEIFPYESQESLTVITESFRDRLTPGSDETWRFKFVNNHGVTGVIPAMAVMSDKALNALNPFRWSFRVTPYFGNPSGLYVNSVLHNLRDSWIFSAPNISTSGFTYSEPQWETYGQLMPQMPRMMRSMSFMAGSSDGYVMDMCCDSAPKMASLSANKMESAQFSDDVEEEAADADAGVSGDNGQLRDIECPLAFFHPTLTSDADGSLEVSFTVPDFNTTWQFQLLGYDESLHTAGITLDALASKPVMVQTNAPRFLRTGDEAVVRATLMNNSDSEAPVAGRMEVFNPIDGSLIASADVSREMLAAKGSRVMQIAFATPSDLALIGVRSYAIGDGHRDGEQVLVGVLPSSSPVFESVPFYIGISQDTFEAELPVYPDDAVVTLNYCDNPVWMCLTALPEVMDTESKSVLAKVRALFGGSVADAIAREYPQVREAITHWKANPQDSVLVSSLSKGEEQKILGLGHTLWVKDAASETERMMNLDRLLDGERNRAIISRLVDDILAMQSPQGGWSWCEGMKASEYITGRLLLNFAAMKDLDALPESKRLDEAIEKGIRFCDNELYDDYIKSKKHFSTRQMLNYLYIRSYFDVPSTETFARLKKEALKAVTDDWRDFDIYDKATAAMLLNREGYGMLSRSILESLRQYAVCDPARGIWFDNTGGGCNSFPGLIITTQVLEAFHEVLPSDEAMIDGLRQWLVLQRQAQNWGKESYTAEVVAAILRSGTGWIADASHPQISLGGRLLELPASDRFMGEFTLHLNPGEASKALLRVCRQGSHPSWGGVLSQYVQPMAEVKGYSIPELSVTKEIFAVEETPDGTVLSRCQEFRIGQKVRVSITINNSRDIEYVALTDERAACLSPIDQLSEYDSWDNVWGYREVCNSQTNLFFSYLPKGSHVVTYDCYVSQAGVYAPGIATVQSIYAPLLVAHSAGGMLPVRE